jgi:hypothetical protein
LTLVGIPLQREQAVVAGDGVVRRPVEVEPAVDQQGRALAQLLDGGGVV